MMSGASRSSRRTRQSFNYEDLFGNSGTTKRQSRSRSQYNQNQNFSQQEENLDVTQELNLTAQDLMSEKNINVKMNSIEKCTKCTGVGSICNNCGGTGIVKNSKTLSVKIPKGVKEGQKIRLKGEGKSDRYGRKGDLYFVIKFKDVEYAIDGENLTKIVEITPAQAVLGCKKDIKTLHGTICIKVPAETRTGRILRLKDLGLPKKNGGFGDLNIRISINLPKNISPTQLELYKKLLETE